MPNILLSGPAGAGKSAIARRLQAAATVPTVVADFQAIVVALLLLERGPDGLYRPRPPWILPLAEYTRAAVITGATGRDLDVIATNADGDPGRRRALLDRLGAGASERVIDPGRDVVAARLADAETGELSPECSDAIGRWYGRLP